MRGKVGGATALLMTPQQAKHLSYLPGHNRKFRPHAESREHFDARFMYYWTKRLRDSSWQILMKNWLVMNKEIPQQYEWAKIQVKEWIEKNIGRR
jgi:hypothetical protein